MSFLIITSPCLCLSISLSLSWLSLLPKAPHELFQGCTSNQLHPGIPTLIRREKGLVISDRPRSWPLVLATAPPSAVRTQERQGSWGVLGTGSPGTEGGTGWQDSISRAGRALGTTGSSVGPLMSVLQPLPDIARRLLAMAGPSLTTRDQTTAPPGAVCAPLGARRPPSSSPCWSRT